MFLKNSDAIPVVIDTDNAFGMPVRDIDDGVALLIALASKEIDVKAVVGSSCNCRAYEAALNTLYLFRQFGIDTIPVGLGAEKPLSGDRDPHHDFLDAKAESANATYWKDSPVQLIPDFSVEEASTLPDGADVLVEAVRSNPHKITVLTLGSFTNLARAMEQAPDIVPLIKEVVHMGGSFTPREGELEFEWDTADIPPEVWETTLRFNTWYDREATAMVLRSGVPVRFITANVTSHFYLRENHLQQLKKKAEGPCAEYVLGGIEPWLLWSMTERKVAGAHMHDPLTVLTLIDPSLCCYRSMKADVEGFLHGGELFPQLDGENKGNTPPDRFPTVQVAVNARIAEAERLMVSLLEYTVDTDCHSSQK